MGSDVSGTAPPWRRPRTPRALREPTIPAATLPRCHHRAMTSTSMPTPHVPGALPAALVASTCALGVLAVCDDDDDSTPTPMAARHDGSSVLPPIIADLDSIDGNTVEVKVGTHIDLTGDTATYADWTGEIADPPVAEFIAGTDEGAASFNPGIKGLAPGTTGSR